MIRATSWKYVTCLSVAKACWIVGPSSELARKARAKTSPILVQDLVCQRHNRRPGGILSLEIICPYAEPTQRRNSQINLVPEIRAVKECPPVPACQAYPSL